jgi:hypothetical protein
MEIMLFSPILLSGLMPFLLFFEELFADMNTVLKIFAFLTIVAYVTQHIGKGPLGIMIIAVLTYLIAFDYWQIFGGIYVLYMLVLFGVTQLLMDFFILAPQAAMEQNMGGGEELAGQPTGHDMRDRQHKMMEMRRRARMF